MSEIQTSEVPKKSKGPIVEPALCRGCRSIKKCRLLTAEYEWMGTKEIYSDMFVDVFGLILSHLDEEDEKSSCICATCVRRLREALAFRQQVLSSEQLFLQARLYDKPDCEVGVKVEVKSEDERRGAASGEGGGSGGEGEGEACPPGAASPDSSDEDDLPILALLPPPAPPAPPAAPPAVAARVRQLQLKLDRMLDPPAPAPPPTQQDVGEPTAAAAAVKPKPPKPRAQPPEPGAEREAMALSNAAVIVTSSYVCPFLNRISMYYCFYCKDQFPSPAELRAHTWRHDPALFRDSVESRRLPKMDVTRVDCRLCDRRIPDLPSFRDHVASEHNIQLFPVPDGFLKFKLSSEAPQCTECGRAFPYFDSLKKHMAEHFGTLTCDVCGACFLEGASLRTHIRAHSKVEADFPCEVCGKNLKSKYSRRLHVATVHEKRPTVNCYKCSDSFLSYAQRNRHLIEAHGDARAFRCALCDKVYNRRKTLMEHHRRNHQKVMRHQCPVCEQRFYLPSRLKEHVAAHAADRGLRCHLCAKVCSRPQALQEHMRSHAAAGAGAGAAAGGDKRYKCHLCASAFTQQANWKNHLKRHHIPYGPPASFA